MQSQHKKNSVRRVSGNTGIFFKALGTVCFICNIFSETPLIIFASSVDPDQMPCSAASRSGAALFAKVPVTGCKA